MSSHMRDPPLKLDCLPPELIHRIFETCLREVPSAYLPLAATSRHLRTFYTHNKDSNSCKLFQQLIPPSELIPAYFYFICAPLINVRKGKMPPSLEEAIQHLQFYKEKGNPTFEEPMDINMTRRVMACLLQLRELADKMKLDSKFETSKMGHYSSEESKKQCRKLGPLVAVLLSTRYTYDQTSTEVQQMIKFEQLKREGIKGHDECECAETYKDWNDLLQRYRISLYRQERSLPFHFVKAIIPLRKRRMRRDAKFLFRNATLDQLVDALENDRPGLEKILRELGLEVKYYRHAMIGGHYLFWGTMAPIILCLYLGIEFVSGVVGPVKRGVVRLGRAGGREVKRIVVEMMQKMAMRA